MFLSSLSVSSAAQEHVRRDRTPSPWPHQPPRVLWLARSAMPARQLAVEAPLYVSLRWLVTGSRVPPSPNPMALFSGRMNDPSSGYPSTPQ